MITRNDIVLLLTDLQDKGIDVKQQINKLMTSPDSFIEVLKFINDNRQLDVVDFYNKIRVNYNKKKSDLYINIVKEIDEPNEVLTTLSAMLTQIILFAKPLKNKQLFFKHVRADEISKVLSNYFKTYDITSTIKLLRLIKADIKALESIRGN